jgi:hypothetical protein
LLNLKGFSSSAKSVYIDAIFKIKSGDGAPTEPSFFCIYCILHLWDVKSRTEITFFAMTRLGKSS